MIPASFDYHAPKTLDEAVALLARLGDKTGSIPASYADTPVIVLHR